MLNIIPQSADVYCDGWFMLFDATFNNISVMLWRSVLLVKETGVPPEKNHGPVASHWETWSNNAVSSTHRLSGVQIHNFSGDRHWFYFWLKQPYEYIYKGQTDFHPTVFSLVVFQLPHHQISCVFPTFLNYHCHFLNHLQTAIKKKTPFH